MPDIPANAWSQPWTADNRCTQHQARQAELDLAAWLNGAPHVAFDAFCKLLTPILPEFHTLLEVGCGSGFYSEILRYIDGTKQYVGCDISDHMLQFCANRWYNGDDRKRLFVRASADNLWCNPSTYDVVDLAAVIQHLPDYRPALDEAVRVARRYVLLHRVEATSKETYVYENAAYDCLLPTRIINESELFAECEQRGLMLVASEKWGVGNGQWNASYLWEKAL